MAPQDILSRRPPPNLDFSSSQLKLMRRTIGRVCTDAEFDEFIAVAKLCGLDPLRRQITPLVLSAGDADRRQMLPWTTIDGLRVIAARYGDYRPMETAPLIECDGSRVDPDSNPLGIRRAEVRAWKFRDGVWHPVAGEAWWDEFAPLRSNSDEQGVGRASKTLDPIWIRMGRVMIAKCAEAQALRRGWPDLLSGLYSEDELHSARLSDHLASEQLHERERNRQTRPRDQSLWFIFNPNDALVAVARSDIAGSLLEFYAEAETSEEIDQFNRQNRQSLQIFWEWEPRDAHILKELVEERLERLKTRFCAAGVSVTSVTSGVASERGGSQAWGS